MFCVAVKYLSDPTSGEIIVSENDLSSINTLNNQIIDENTIRGTIMNDAKSQLHKVDSDKVSNLLINAAVIDINYQPQYESQISNKKTSNIIENQRENSKNSIDVQIYSFTPQ